VYSDVHSLQQVQPEGGVESYLKAFCSSVVHRQLRELLYVAAAGMNMAPSQVPHSFEPDRLISLAETAIKKRRMREHRYYVRLLELTGRAVALSGDEGRAIEIFNRGRALKEVGAESRFRYFTAFYIHLRSGARDAALEGITQALDAGDLSRRLKTEAMLAQGRVSRQLQNLSGAEAAYRRVLDVGIRRYRPLAVLYLSHIRNLQGRYKEAMKLNRDAYVSFKRAGEASAIRLTDGDLALIYLAMGDNDKARLLLESVIERQTDLLDISSAGGDCQNLGIACARQGDYASACDAYAKALHFHAATGQRHQVAATYQCMGVAFKNSGQLGNAFAALDRAISIAQEMGAPEIEFRSRSVLIGAIRRDPKRLQMLSAQVARCQQLIAEKSMLLSKEALSEYSRRIGDLYIAARAADGETFSERPAETASQADQVSLEVLTTGVEAEWHKALLTSQMGEGVSGNFAPGPEELCEFLLLFTGDYFRFNHYAREFSLSVHRAKPHLRELREKKIIELNGTRKAAKYALSYHRGQKEGIALV